jgi:hypothetical protein
MIVMRQLQGSLPSFSRCWEIVKKWNVQTVPFWKLTRTLENIDPMIILYRSAHPIPTLISWRGCWYTWCGFRELTWLLIWPKCCQVLLFRQSNPILKNVTTTCLCRKLQKLILRPLLLFYIYIRQLIRRMRNTALVIKNFINFSALFLVL